MKTLSYYLLLIAICVPGTVIAQNRNLHHQGRVAVNGANYDGTGQFKFLLYRGATEGTVTQRLWSNASATPPAGEPNQSVSVTVNKGHYSIILGDPPTATMPPLGDDTDGKLYLRIWFNDGVHGFQQLAPDKRVVTPLAASGNEALGNVQTQDGMLTVPSSSIVENLGRTFIDHEFPQAFQSAPAIFTEPTTPNDFDTSAVRVQIVSASETGFRAVVNGLPIVSTQVAPQQAGGGRTGHSLAGGRSGDSYFIVYNDSSDTLLADVSPDLGSVTIPTNAPLILRGTSAIHHEGLALICYRDSEPVPSAPNNPETVLRFSALTGAARGQVANVINFGNIDLPDFFGHAITSIGDKVGILYRDNSNELLYRTADVIDASGVGIQPVLSSPSSIPNTSSINIPSLLEVAGHPAFLLGRFYRRALDSNGTTWGPPVELPLTSAGGLLKVIDGKPVVFSSNKMVRALDAEGATWPSEPETLFHQIPGAGSIQIEKINGLFYMAFGYGGSVYLTQTTSQDISEWLEPIELGSGGTGIAIVKTENQPAIFWFDQTQGNGALLKASPGAAGNFSFTWTARGL